MADWTTDAMVVIEIKENVETINTKIVNKIMCHVTLLPLTANQIVNELVL